MEFGYGLGERTKRNAFWVEYGQPSRRPEAIIDELTAALQQCGFFAIHNSGSLASQFLIYIARRAAIPFVELVLQVKGHERAVNPLAFIVRMSEDELEAAILATVLPFPTVQHCAGYHLGSLIQLPVVYDSGWGKARNMHYDYVENKFVGPANWTLVDDEADFAIAAALRATTRPGIPLIYRQSAEIIHAQLLTPMAGQDARFALAQGMTRYAKQFVTAPGTLFEHELAEFTARLDKAIAIGPGKSHMTPLYRLLPHLNLPACEAYFGAV